VNSRLWEWKIEKHEIQKIGRDGGPKDSFGYFLCIGGWYDVKVYGM